MGNNSFDLGVKGGTMVSPVWCWEINQGSRRQGRIPEVDLPPIGIIDGYLPATRFLTILSPNIHSLIRLLKKYR